MRAHAIGVLGLATVVFLAGCGGGSLRDSAPKGTVKGTVSFEGQPVSEGLVTLYSPSKGIGVTVNLGEGGVFAVEEPVEVGEYTVVVQPPPLPPPSEADMTPKPKTYDNIPSFYHSETTSDLRLMVQEGENTDVKVEMKKKS